MEADEIQCKFPRISDVNGRLNAVRVGQKMDEQYADEEDDGENRRVSSNGGVRGGGVDLGGGVGRFYGWPSSRIVRVSRASGGKDRHSKVLTSKGLRDRRVRLSVNTAIQFYDLQDRLGYDQPSKAVEWLLKAAANSIAELPPMNSLFPVTPKQFSDEKRSSTAGSDQLGFDSAEVDMDGGAGGDPNYSSQQQVTKSSACSSTSETSKGSGLSLSRSESRMKARERAKERVAEKEKEKEPESSHVAAASLNPISQTTSFTELLNGGINNVSVSNTTTASPNANTSGGPSNESNFFLRSPRQWVTSTSMDYFNSGLLGPPAAAPRTGQMHLSANSFTAAAVAASPLFNVAGDHHPEFLQFSFVPDHLVPVVNAAGGGNSNSHNGNNEYNLNFTISSSGNPSGLAGFNRGTLQSNSSSSSLLPHLQRFPDGSPPGFFIGTTTPVDNHHQFLSGYDARLQLCYGDANGNNKHSGQKGKGKN